MVNSNIRNVILFICRGPYWGHVKCPTAIKSSPIGLFCEHSVAQNLPGHAHQGQYWVEASTERCSLFVIGRYLIIRVKTSVGVFYPWHNSYLSCCRSFWCFLTCQPHRLVYHGMIIETPHPPSVPTPFASRHIFTSTLPACTLFHKRLILTTWRNMPVLTLPLHIASPIWLYLTFISFLLMVAAAAFLFLSFFFLSYQLSSWLVFIFACCDYISSNLGAPRCKRALESVVGVFVLLTWRQ